MASSSPARLAMRAGGPSFAFRRSAPRFGLLLATAVVANLFNAGVARCEVVTATWLFGDGSWNGAVSPSHWSTPFYPDNGTPAGTEYIVVIADDPDFSSSVTLDITATIDKLTVNSGDTLGLVTDGGGTGTLFVKISPGTPTITNSGLITIGGGSKLLFDGTGVPGTPMGTLTGGGMVILSGGGIGGTTSPGTETLTTDNTIMGFGAVGAKNLINHGSISASMPMAELGVGSAATGTVKNVGVSDPALPGVRKAGSGSLTAIGGGILKLPSGTFDNTDPMFPGTISAMGGSKVNLGTVGGLTTHIIGGELSTDFDPESKFVNTWIVTLDGVTLYSPSFTPPPGITYATFTQDDGKITNLRGAITNDGVINVSSSGIAGASLLVLDSGDVTLGGTGSITLNGTATADPFNPNFVKIQGKTTARLTIGADQTIIGSGQFGDHATVVSPKLTNHGTITAVTSPTLLVGPPQGIAIFPLILGAPPPLDALINDGTMQAMDNAFLTFNNGIVTNSGPSGPGTIIAHGHSMPSTLNFQEGVTVNGGLVTLDGFFSQINLNNGTIHGGT